MINHLSTPSYTSVLGALWTAVCEFGLVGGSASLCWGIVGGGVELWPRDELLDTLSYPGLQ